MKKNNLDLSILDIIFQNHRRMEESKDMFWGLVVKAGKRYETEVERPFRMTKACLVPSTAGGKVTSVMVENEVGDNFILANLNVRVFNETLDVAFNLGEKICFKVEGPGTVHLTGSLVPEITDDLMEDDSDDEDICELEDIAKEAEMIRKGIKALPPGGVGGDSSDSDSDEEEIEGVKRKTASTVEAASKKLKLVEQKEEESDDESDDEEDSEDEDEDDEDEDEDEDDELDAEELTEEQIKKLDLVRKIYEAANEKVDTEVMKSKKNKAVVDAKKGEAVKDVNNEKKKANAEQKKAKGETKETVKNNINATKDGQKEKAVKSEGPGIKTLKCGVKIEELKLGSGAVAKKGNFVGMFYSGRIVGKPKTFDSCLSGKPFRFRLGSNQVDGSSYI